MNRLFHVITIWTQPNPAQGDAYDEEKIQAFLNSCVEVEEKKSGCELHMVGMSSLIEPGSYPAGPKLIFVFREYDRGGRR